MLTFKTLSLIDSTVELSLNIPPHVATLPCEITAFKKLPCPGTMHKAGQVTAAAQWSAYSNEKYKQRQGVLISHEPTGGYTSGA